MDPKIKKFIDVLSQLGPSILAMTVPASVPFIPTIVAAIAEAQQIAGADGPAKKVHVLGVLSKALTVYNGLTKGQPVDSALLLSTVGAGIDMVIGVVKIVEGTKVAVDPTLLDGLAAIKPVA